MHQYLGPMLASLFLSLSVAAKDYTDYHRWINRAEAHLVHGRIDSSLFYYQKAFAGYNFIFAKDAFIAAQISFRHKRKELFEQFLLRGADYGLSPECLAESGVTRGFVQSEDYQRLRDLMQTRNRTFLNNRDLLMRQDWERRFAKEQGSKKDADMFKEVVNDNVAEISRQMRQGLFPADSVIGLIARDCESMGNTRAFYTLAHYDCMMVEYGKELWNYVLAGQLHPRDFAALHWFEYSVRKKNVPPDRYTNDACKEVSPARLEFNLLSHPVKDSAMIATIARNRQQYLIADYETDLRKAALEGKEGYKLFFGYR